MRRWMVVLGALLVVVVAAWTSWNSMPDLPRGYAPYVVEAAADDHGAGDPAADMPAGEGFFLYRGSGMSDEEMIGLALRANGRAKVVSTLTLMRQKAHGLQRAGQSGLPGPDGEVLTAERLTTWLDLAKTLPDTH